MMAPSHLSKRAVFLATYRRNQSWSLLDSIIYYTAKNSSSLKVYEKLIKSSKYFFVKNPLLVVKSFKSLTLDSFSNHGWRTYFNGKCIVDLQDIPTKIWVNNKLAVEFLDENPDFQYLSSTVLPRIYKSDIEYLSLIYQNIAFDDLIWLITKCKEINLSMVTVKDANDAVVTLEKIIEALPTVKSFYYDLQDMPLSTSIISTDTVQKLIGIPHFCNLSYFRLIDVPDNFDVDTFYSYIKKNKQTKISLRYGHHQNRLQEVVNEIIGTEEHDYVVPLITFPGQDRAYFKTLFRLYR